MVAVEQNGTTSPNDQNLVVNFTFPTLGDEDKSLVRSLVDKNILEKMSSYLDRVYARSKDARVMISVTISKNKREKGGYDGNFSLMYSGASKPIIYSREDFKNLSDLVNHAFDHFKQVFSDAEVI